MRSTEKPYVEQGLDRFIQSNLNNLYSNLENVYILPIRSDPTNPDSDGDGIADGAIPDVETKYTNDEKPLKYSFKHYDDELQKVKQYYPNATFLFREYNFTLKDFVDLQYESGWNLTYEEKYKAVDSEQKRLFQKHLLTYNGMFFPSREGLLYYCDPVTHLDDTYIFAFYDLRLKEKNDLVENAKMMLRGSYFDQDEKINDYAEYFAEASETSGLDLTFIISKCFIESATKNKGYCSKLCAGNVANSGRSKGKVVYNMYGIGALDSKDGPITTGISKASAEGWTTERLAIVEGAKYISDRFLKNCQYTQYMQKYDIVTYDKNNTIGYQYATAINYAYVGANEMKSMLCINNNEELVFEIPIYNNY